MKNVQTTILLTPEQHDWLKVNHLRIGELVRACIEDRMENWDIRKKP